MAGKNWMTRLVSDFGQAAEDMKSLSSDVIPMPSPSLNWAVGNGGLAEGKIATFFGAESSGKSLLAQLEMIAIQKKYPDAIVVYMDTEFSFNKDWFKKLGGDLGRLYVRQTNDPVKVFDYIWGEMQELLQDGCPIKGLVIDSMKNIAWPKDMKKQSTDYVQGGSGAAFLGPIFKRMVPVIRQHNVLTILVQQVYEELDQYKKMRNPYIVPDGRALKHASDYMIQVDKLETKENIMEEGKTIMGSAAQIGHKVRVKVKKNRTAAPYRVAEFWLNYEQGIVRVGEETFELGKSLGVINHPINPDTGKPNNQYWDIAGVETVKGEENAMQAVVGSEKLQHAIIYACNHASEDAIKARLDNLEGEQPSVTIDLDAL